MGIDGSPFGEDVMTIIMGIEPSEPGMHGKMEAPCPTTDAVGLVTKIRDMCDEWLRSAGKGVESDTNADTAPEDGESED